MEYDRGNRCMIQHVNVPNTRHSPLTHHAIEQAGGRTELFYFYIVTQLNSMNC